MTNIKKDLIEQLEKVANMLNPMLKSKKDDSIIQTIYNRYFNAIEILVKDGDISKIMIKGGCRAYLDSYNDYLNPLLDEMYKAEEMLEILIKNNR